MIEMRLQSIKINDTGDRQYINLKERDGSRTLPIVIGYPEVQAIDRFVKDYRLARPMTHDLMANLLEATECKVERVTVTDLRDGTFFAMVRLQRPDGGVVEVDARPSDGIALATAVKAPIFVSEDVLAEAAGIDT